MSSDKDTRDWLEAINGAGKPGIPKGFRLKAQGCEERATLGNGDT
jgi:hypothetical protein